VTMWVHGRILYLYRLPSCFCGGDFTLAHARSSTVVVGFKFTKVYVLDRVLHPHVHATDFFFLFKKNRHY
jgi:hypothetical protein